MRPPRTLVQRLQAALAVLFVAGAVAWWSIPAGVLVFGIALLVDAVT